MCWDSMGMELLSALLLGCGGGDRPLEDGGEPPIEHEDSDEDVESVGVLVPGVDTGSGDSAADTALVGDDDGDGFVGAEDGGDDCDDEDPGTYPGQTETCDPIDRDCDGEPLATGVCSTPQDLELVLDGSWVGEGTTDHLGWPRTVGDLDGDGMAELMFTGAQCRAVEDHLAYGVQYVVSGDSFGDGVSVFDASVAYWLGDVAWWNLYYGGAAGDYDGDGLEDLWTISVSSTYYGAAAFLMRGPVEQWEGGSYASEEADAYWWQEYTNDGFGVDWVGDLDLNGDAYADSIVVRAGNTSYDWLEPGLLLLLGSGDPDSSNASELPFVEWEGDEWYSSIQTITDVGDLSGDGVNDFILTNSRELVAIDGAALILEGLVADIQLGGLEADDASGGFGEFIAGPGDWTGDGVPEVVLGEPHSDYVGTDGGAVLVLDGAFLLDAGHGQTAVDVLAGSWYGTQPGQLAGANVEAVDDVDGDSISDLVYTQHGDNGAWIERSAAGVPSPWSPMEEGLFLSAVIEGTPPATVSDVDGDGQVDLLLSEPGWGDRRGRISVVGGADIPWGESEYW